MKSPSNKLSIEEKMRFAREQAAAAKERERLEEEAYFLKISSGKSWRIFRIFSFYCLGLAVLISFETIFDGEEERIGPSQYQFYEAAITIGDDWYTPYYTEIAGFLDTSFVVVHSPLFGAAKFLRWTSAYQDSKTPLKYTEYTTWRLNSIYSYYVFIQLVLLIPLFVVWYKRPSPLFKFSRMLCLVLIFPAGIYLLFVTFGIVDLLPFNL